MLRLGWYNLDEETYQLGFKYTTQVIIYFYIHNNLIHNTPLSNFIGT